VDERVVDLRVVDVGVLVLGIAALVAELGEVRDALDEGSHFLVEGQPTSLAAVISRTAAL
jgi:hypothetical protein